MNRTTRVVTLDHRARQNLSFVEGVVRRALSFSAVPGGGGMVMGGIALAAAPLAALQGSPAGWLLVWLAAALAAFVVGLLAVVVKLRRSSSRLWSPQAVRFFSVLSPPLLAGAALTAALVDRQQFELLPALWLLLYGAGVVGAGEASIRPVGALGLTLMVCGIVALIAPGAGNVMMAAGFGAAQVAFGALIAWRKNG